MIGQAGRPGGRTPLEVATRSQYSLARLRYNRCYCIPASAGVKAGMSPLPGGRYILCDCDPIQHVSSRSGCGKASCELLYSVYLTFTFTVALNVESLTRLAKIFITVWTMFRISTLQLHSGETTNPQNFVSHYRPRKQTDLLIQEITSQLKQLTLFTVLNV